MVTFHISIIPSWYTCSSHLLSNDVIIHINKFTGNLRCWPEIPVAILAKEEEKVENQRSSNILVSLFVKADVAGLALR